MKREFSLAMLVGGLAVAAYGGLQTFRHPSSFYSNYWGGQVYTPIVLAVGVLMILLSPFKLKASSLRRRRQKRVHFPHEKVGREWEGGGKQA